MERVGTGGLSMVENVKIFKKKRVETDSGVIGGLTSI